jgi:xanthine dehydrogenase molybdopterin-binding subunit B
LWVLQAPALITGLDASEALAMPGVVDFVTAADIPGFNCTSPFGPGEELLFPAIYNASFRFVFFLFAELVRHSQRTCL